MPHKLLQLPQELSQTVLSQERQRHVHHGRLSLAQSKEPRRMIALPGCTLAIGHEEDFHLIMDTFLEALRRNIETRKPDRMINEIDLPDIPLWTIWAIQQYRRFMGAGKCRERYGAVVRELVEHIRAGRIPQPHGRHQRTSEVGRRKFAGNLAFGLYQRTPDHSPHRIYPGIQCPMVQRPLLPRKPLREYGERRPHTWRKSTRSPRK